MGNESKVACVNRLLAKQTERWMDGWMGGLDDQKTGKWMND